MKKFEKLDQLDEGKLYIIKTTEGQRPIVFRDGNEIRSNAQKGGGNPIRKYSEKDILAFEEYSGENNAQ